MVREVSGDLLASDAVVLVNPVNTVGVMGKGLALQFKRAFPSNTYYYEGACRTGLVRIGRMFTVRVRDDPIQYVMNFPTKQHWRELSSYEIIVKGLLDMRSEIIRLNVKSVAVPALGCGLGGLEWDKVRQLIVRAFESLPEVDVLLFSPEGI